MRSLLTQRLSAFSYTALLICSLLFFSISAPRAALASEEIQPKQNSDDSLAQSIRSAMIVGPNQISLIDQGVLNLPDGYFFLPKKQASALMKEIGNQVDTTFIGLVMPSDENAQWYISIDYINAGYVNDDDAKSWNANDLFKNLADGTKNANKDRIANGFKPLEAVRWIDSPTYDTSTHRLIWSMLARHSESEPEEDYVVNYSTYVLGRSGYFELDLVTSNSSISTDKLDARRILESIDFNIGNRYEDYDNRTDKMAAYGIATLVTGVAAKKLGLFALGGALLAKLWKLIFIVPVLLLSGLRKIFGGNSSHE